MQLLDENSVVAYLKSRNIFSDSADVAVEILTGGVSNVVLAVSGEGRDLVVKQALPELKVAQKWSADQRRAIVEANALQVYQEITPENVPALVECDPERFVVILQRAPRSVTNWKEDMLAGKILPAVAGDVGEILGKWHKNTSAPLILDQFQEDTLFEQLRISPFYRAIALRHQSINRRISSLIDELENNKTALVHGDYSPKNILVSSSNVPIILDFEVAHAGNPVFDLGFLLGHLLTKSEYVGTLTAKSKIAQSAYSFLQRYEQSLGRPASPTFTWHVAAISLARVDGVSPVSYLNPEMQGNLRNTCLGILQSEDPPSLTEVFSEL